jgi:hypothetical protein
LREHVLREHEKNTRNKRIAMSNYDIDFPVSESWAEFYAAQGLSVDPSMVVGEEWLRDEAKIRRRKPDPELLKERITASRKDEPAGEHIVREHRRTNQILWMMLKKETRPSDSAPVKKRNVKEGKERRERNIRPRWKLQESTTDI